MKKVVDSVTPIAPKNGHPSKADQTLIVYGNRHDALATYTYKNVPNPVIINGQNMFPFGIPLKSSEPDKYGDSGVFFNNDFSKITKTLSENDTVMTIKLPLDWSAKLTIIGINLVVSFFDFRVCFKVPYNVPPQSKPLMTTILTATNVVPTSSSVYVEPIKIRWGFYQKEPRPGERRNEICGRYTDR